VCFTTEHTCPIPRNIGDGKLKSINRYLTLRKEEKKKRKPNKQEKQNNNNRV